MIFSHTDWHSSIIPVSCFSKSVYKSVLKSPELLSAFYFLLSFSVEKEQLLLSWRSLFNCIGCQSLTAAHDMQVIGARLGSIGSTLDLKMANPISSSILGNVLVSRSLVRLLGSDQLWSSHNSRPSFPIRFSKKIPRSFAVTNVFWFTSTI